jgi:predicted Fe-Mo cluster-binding NifX family protein
MANTKIIVNCETGEVTEVELTAEEIAQREADAAAYAVQKAEEDAAKAAKEALKASAKVKLVAGEPLTAEEANTLVI